MAVKDVETEFSCFFFFVCVCVCVCVCVLYLSFLYCQTLLPTVPFFECSHNCL